MKLKNYTSTIKVEKIISDIESLLVEGGATRIEKFYENQQIMGFIFQIPMEGKELNFKLPVKPLAVERVLKSKVKKFHKQTHQRILDQSQRTAWKILYDWVNIQLTMIVLQQAEATQIFLPYLYNPNSGQTFFEMMKETNFKQLENK